MLTDKQIKDEFSLYEKFFTVPGAMGRRGTSLHSVDIQELVKKLVKERIYISAFSKQAIEFPWFSCGTRFPEKPNKNINISYHD